jgi:hypothetical protein
VTIEKLSAKKDAMELVYHKLTTDIRELQQNIMSITVLGFTQNPLLAHKTISEQIWELNSLTSDLEDLYKILTNIYTKILEQMIRISPNNAVKDFLNGILKNQGKINGLSYVIDSLILTDIPYLDIGTKSATIELFFSTFEPNCLENVYKLIIDVNEDTMRINNIEFTKGSDNNALSNV